MLHSQKYTILICTGKCILFGLYNDMCRLTPQHSTLLSASSDSGSHVYATSRSSSLYTDRRTSCRNTACSVFASAANTRNTGFVFLLKASGLNALYLINLAETQMDLAYPWKCHSLSHFLHANGYTVDNQIRTSRKLLWVILPPHDLWIRNAFSMVMSVR
jgi:hypothetical protein